MEKQHNQERQHLYLGEVNFQERARLLTQQLQEIKALTSQQRQVRIAIKKRHTQQADNLDQGLS